MVLERIGELLATSSNGRGHFPPTELYNEGWLLRLTVDYLARHQLTGHPLSLLDGASWFSEALLPSQFAPRFRGDKLSEARTHADGVIGHFDIGLKGKADFSLTRGAQQFLVLEAKMSSGLSKSTKNSLDYDQAARNIACMAEVLYRARQAPIEIKRLGFYVLAPEAHIAKGKFTTALTRTAIAEKVSQRVEAYQDEAKIQWYKGWFELLLGCLDIQALSWESIIEFIHLQDAQAGEEFQQFYQLCFEFNKKTGKNRV